MSTSLESILGAEIWDDDKNLQRASGNGTRAGTTVKEQMRRGGKKGKKRYQKRKYRLKYSTIYNDIGSLTGRGLLQRKLRGQVKPNFVPMPTQALQPGPTPMSKGTAYPPAKVTVYA